MSQEVVGIEVVSDEVVGDGGFLSVRRMRLRNIRRDGTLSREYICDFLNRSNGTDAVVVVIFRRAAQSIEVLLRSGIRPALFFGRGRAPIPDVEARLYFDEVVAGIIETGDIGEAGIRGRAVIEVAEEAGIEITSETLFPLGAATFPSPGSKSEMFYFFAAEVPVGLAPGLPPGDGSPMEEGVSLRWMELERAIDASVAGELSDSKTELILRRLRDYLR